MRFLFILTLAFILPFASHAENHIDMPRQHIDADQKETATVLNVTPDKSEMIQLHEEAASVVVGNPNHINVILDTPTTLIVVPRASGASHFSVIGKSGDVILQRHVVVGAPQATGNDSNKYVRIRRSCAASSSSSCKPSSVYFCNGTCHEVNENTSDSRRR